jgi:lysophospholipase L1-like esterase
MHNLLLSFGDSWAYGAELPDANREQLNFTGKLADLLQLNQVKNFSEVGSSISHLQIQLRNAIADCQHQIGQCTTIAVFFLTGQERFLFFDHRGDFANLTASGYIARPLQYDLRSQFDSIYSFYYKNIHSTATDIITLNTNLLALQAICQHHNIQDYYISGWEKLDLWPEVNTNRIYAHGQQHCGDVLKLDDHLKNDQYIVPGGTHPNAAGHELIAQTLFGMINSKVVDTAV